MSDLKMKSILVPTDFSDLATHALKYAAALAGCAKGSLTVLYADPFLPPPHFTAGQIEDVKHSLEHSKAAARHQLEAYCRKHVPKEIPCETQVMEGLAVPSIINVAEEKDAGMIVMGTHGRSGISRVMLGSVTERVLRETSRPVLTVRFRENAPAGEFVPVKQVLCPVNFSEVSRKALDYAVQVAECFKASLSVLHVVEPGTGKSLTGQEAREKLCQWIPPQFRERCSLKEAVSEGEAAREILDDAKRQECDLIVMGAQHQRFFDSTVIGATTVRVTRHAPCPVLTVINK